jgi:type VI secretion system protein ImpF
MAGAGRKDRVSPPLMYAFRGAHEAHDAKKKLDLRDDAGDRVIASRRASPRAAISESVLRREVARDLEGLLNTIAFESSTDIEDFDHARKSILNYGFPDIAHISIDEYAVGDLAGDIRDVLMHYEPRLQSNSVRVTRDTLVDATELKLRFVVSADLMCDPVNVPVEFVADVELDSGKILINRL